LEGVVYFGQHSIDVSKWANTSLVDDALRVIRNLIEKINKSGYAKVKVPTDWGDVRLSSKNFWEKIEDIFQGQNDLIGYIYQELFDRVFNECIDKNQNYEDAEHCLIAKNPNKDKSEYYGAFKLNGFWPDVPEDIHVSNEQDLNNWAQKFLGEVPVNENDYVERCKKIFSNLIFHPDFLEGLKGHGAAPPAKDSSGKKIRSYAKAPETGIRGFSLSVTKALSALNLVQIENKPTAEILKEIKEKSGFDCTPQGSDKKDLKIVHKFEDGTQQKINCEFHIKFSSNNINDGVEYKERIYFGFAEHNGSKKILVFHSGKHI
jgi:hypothetical protein